MDGCWFQGFDTALDVASFGGSITRIKQSMMVRAARTGATFQSAGRSASGGGRAGETPRTIGGWPWSIARRRAQVCSLVDFAPDARLQVGIKECAILADALLAWQSSKPGTSWAEVLDWSGEGNQYDIRGKSWVVPSSEGAPELLDGPTDLASWQSKVAEGDAVLPPVRFRVASVSRSESQEPSDFAIIDPEVRPPGADPVRVGPTAPERK